jgi:hypothetical protein
MKKRFYLLIAGFLILASDGRAQYMVAIGLRSGGTSGLTAKYIGSSGHASELILGFWNDGLSFTGLFEKHPNAFGKDGLHWLVGGGGHVTFYGENNREISPPAWYGEVYTDIKDGTFGIGIDLILGIEYKFPSFPLAVSAGFKPYVEFTTNVIRFSPDPGVGVQLAF